MIDARELAIYGLTLGGSGTAALAVTPWLMRIYDRSVSKVERYQQLKVEKAARTLGEGFVNVQPAWLKLVYGLGPVVGGALAWLLFSRVSIACVGVVIGLVLPDFWVRQTVAMRKRRFQAQLVDALFILSSSLKAGLSLTQAFEVLEAELPPPASQEFGLLVKAHRVGQTMEEALQGLNARMACEEMDLITTAILVERETGGDVTAIISQLIVAIREKKKLNDKVFTLTIQGRLQAYIMSLLPFLFAMFIRTFNPNYFDILLNDPTGHVLIAIAGGLWVVGMFVLLKLSKVEV